VTPWGFEEHGEELAALAPGAAAGDRKRLCLSGARGCLFGSAL
jgi:hypothetical protein